jgi:ABC-2 type transport system permease protein
VTTLRVLRYAFLSGLRDYTWIFTWKSWLAGWYLRIVAQVSFFALIGRLLDSEAQVEFLLVGNAIVVAASEAIWALNVALWERQAGTLPLLLASPSSPVLVFTSRASYMIADGLAASLGALFVVGPLFGIEFPWPEVLLVVPLTLLVGVTTYFVGTFLAGLIIRWREGNIVVANVAIVAVMTICGVNVPLSFYPAPLEWLSQLLPLTHGLIAIRGVIDGAAASEIWREVAFEALVGSAWLVLAVATFDRFVSRGRRDGALEFAA